MEVVRDQYDFIGNMANFNPGYDVVESADNLFCHIVDAAKKCRQKLFK